MRRYDTLSATAACERETQNDPTATCYSPANDDVLGWRVFVVKISNPGYPPDYGVAVLDTDPESNTSRLNRVGCWESNPLAIKDARTRAMALAEYINRSTVPDPLPPYGGGILALRIGVPTPGHRAAIERAAAGAAF